MLAPTARLAFQRLPPWTGGLKFFFDAVSMNIEKKVQSLQANSGLYAVRSCQDRPVIVGWSTAPRGQVIEECLGQLPKKLAAARACWQGLNHHTPIRDETGWTTRRSLGEVGTDSAHSKPVCLCGDCTFLDEIHRAGLEKKSRLERAVSRATPEETGSRPAPAGKDQIITQRIGVENYGDVLFPLIAERELTDRLGSVNLQRFSYFEKAPPRWPYKVTSLAELPKIAASLDGMIIGGGHLIRFDKHIAPGYQPPLPDIHHPTGYWLNPALLALHHGCPVVWNAPGAYGEVPHWARPLMELAIKFSAYVAVRDEPARQMLAPFANARDIAVVPDTCFGIPSIVDPKRPSQDFSTFRQSLNILDPYLVIQATGGLDAFVRLVREHADRFAGYRLVSLRMGPILGDEDNVLRDVPGLIQLPGWPHPLVMAELIAGAKGAVGVSLHLAITALAFGVPVFRPKNACTGKYAILAGQRHCRPAGVQEHITRKRIASEAGVSQPAGQARVTLTTAFPPN